MISIEAIASYVPEGREDNLAKCGQFEMTPDFVHEKIGVLTAARAGDSESSSDMCIAAFSALEGKVTLNVSEVECILVCTQNADNGGLPHVSALVHGAIGASDACACFDIGLGCSGYVYGLSIAQAFMEANGFRRGLLFTSDPYSKVVDPRDRNTSLLFGDAATVTLLSDRGIWMPSNFTFATRGSAAEHLQVRDGTLRMNGRAVFNFSATAVPQQVRALLDKTDLTVSDIDLYFFHQGSR